MTKLRNKCTATTAHRQAQAPAAEPARFYLYLRQPDRRLYPCVVLKDERGMVAAHAATLGDDVSVLTAQQIEVLKTFRGAEQIRVKRVKPGREVKGKWVQSNPKQYSYMLTRPDVPSAKNERVRQYGWALAALQAHAAAQKPPLFDPHALSGLKPHQLPPGMHPNPGGDVNDAQKH